MIIHPKVRGFICTTTHPLGCELNVRDQLIIHSTGKVNGTVRYGKVLIEEGGQLCGDIQMMNKSENKPALQAARIVQS